MNKQSRKTKDKKSSVESIPARPLWMLALASSLLTWLAFPPVGLGFLGWVAPIGWIAIAASPQPLGRRGWWILWLSGCAVWLPLLHGIRLAFWPLYAAWLALALYLAIYTPLFVAACRWMRSSRVPLVIAAPVSWVAWEYCRSYMLTGYSANMLVHTQAENPIAFQLADQLGGYGISFAMVMFSAAVFCCLKPDPHSSRFHPLPVGCGVASLVVVFGYGYWRLQQADQLYASRKPLMRALLIQENTPSMFDADLQGIRDAWRRYLDTTQTEATGKGRLDLVVWPESTFTAGVPWVSPKLPPQLPPDPLGRPLDEGRMQNWVDDCTTEFGFKIDLLHQAIGMQSTTDDQTPLPMLLLGADAVVVDPEGMRRHNSAILVDRDGQFVGRYDKVHLVMFGEYIPLGPLLKWLGDMFGFVSATPGKEPASFAIGDARVTPSICFESMMPRVIRGQLAELYANQEAPDLLINLTNDSWFRGSTILDHHLACSAVCAVENRRPMLVAANTGLSAEIDGSGRVLQVLDRFEVGSILAEPIADSRWGAVQSIGYPLGWVSLLAVLLCCVQSWRKRGTVHIGDST